MKKRADKIRIDAKTEKKAKEMKDASDAKSAVEKAAEVIEYMNKVEQTKQITETSNSSEKPKAKEDSVSIIPDTLPAYAPIVPIPMGSIFHKPKEQNSSFKRQKTTKHQAKKKRN